MECNKEDGLKAKHLAEQKLKIKDFHGALKNAVKAQRLYPELENISQLIVVCEVLFSAETKICDDKNWYGILKIRSSADQILIKKQYRKLALILHPDKNKFYGAIDAFTLIGDAQKVLLDREKRVFYDNKCRFFANHHPCVETHFNLSGRGSGNSGFNKKQAETGLSGKYATFWTVCAFCFFRHQLHRNNLNKVVSCKSCKKWFTAFESNAQGTYHAAPSTTQTQKQPSFPQQSTIPRSYTTKPVFKRKDPPKAQVSAKKKRKKIIEEFIESSDSSESSESEEEEVEELSESEGNGVPSNVNMNPDKEGEQPRRSSRSKRNVSYKENLNDIDIDIDIDIDNDDITAPIRPDEKSDENDTFENAKVVKDHGNGKEYQEPNSGDKEREKANGDNVEDVDEEKEEEEKPEPELFTCPDPEFSDFEKNRSEASFNTGQIWACYDSADAMPRLYAFIKKVITRSPVFKLQIQWLKPDPVNDDEKKWVKNDMHVSCGYFKRGRLENTEGILSFSHLVTREEEKAGRINIIPRKGETWALFKNWPMNSHSSDEERKYEYEFAEMLSDYDKTLGVQVSYLKKVKGFVCLFKRKKDGVSLIAGSDKYRFAHMVPSCKIGGEEEKSVSEGCFELDPAGLPPSTFEQMAKEKEVRDNWSDPWVLSFCGFLNDYITKHGRSSSFKWIELQPEFEKRINHTFFSKGALKNKYDNMKKDFNLWKSLKNGETGLGWDESTKTLICSDDWWMAKIKENHKFKKLRSKQPSMELQEAWDQLFGDAVASGVNCVASSIDSSRVNEVPSENPGDNDLVSGEEVDDFQAKNEKSSRLENLERQVDELFDGFADEANGGRTSTSNQNEVIKQVDKNIKMSTKLKPVNMKRKGRESSGATMLKAYLRQSNVFQQEIIQILKSYASSGNETSKYNIKAAISVIGHMVEEEKMIEGDDVWLFAMDLFEDPVKREIFINLPNDNRRLDWLLHKQNSLR